MVESQLKTRYLSVLGLSAEAEFKEVQAAFRRLVLKYHPDVNRGKSSAMLFRDIIEAYNGLQGMRAAAEAKSGERISSGIRGDQLIREMPLADLADRVRYSGSPQVRRSAVMAVGMYGGAEAKEVLFHAVTDRDPDVQASALAALGGVCGAKDGGRLLLSLFCARRRENIPLFVKTAFKAMLGAAVKPPFSREKLLHRETAVRMKGECGT